MIKNPLTLLVVATSPLVIALCGAVGGPDVGSARPAALDSGDRSLRSADCVCEIARKTSGWCRGCKVGYIASIRIPSPMLFEALDAHGHAIEPGLLRCDGCRAAVETDGFCDRSGIGFVNGQAYLSKLAYYAARGEVKAPSDLDCATCRKNSRGHGWCEACGIGRVGPLSLESRDDLEGAWQAFERLGRALNRLAECETCAVAMVTGGRCSVCRVSY